ncbi:MAG: biopolymer transporter ExbD [Crocinitomicaceae bacterium]
MNMTTPIDLPEKKPIDSSQTEQGQITAVILENNKYTFDDDPSEYNWEEYKEKLGGKLTESNFSIREIKIAGHKDARYESVFKVLAFCQANELEPILAYQN